VKPTSRSIFSFLFGTILVFQSVFSAHAHVGEPVSQRVWITDNSWLLQTNFGAMGSTFDGFVCEEAFLGGDRFFIVPFGQDLWTAFSATNIWQTADGCSFQSAGELPGLPTDVARNLDAGLAAWVQNQNGPELYTVSALGEAGGSAAVAKIEADIAENIYLTAVRFANEETLIVSGYNREAMGAGVIMSVNRISGATTVLDTPTMTYPYVLDARESEVLWLGKAETQNLFWGTLESPAAQALPIEAWPTDASFVDEARVVVSGLNQSRGLSVGTLTGDLVDGQVNWEAFADEMTAACVRPWEEGFLVCTLNRFDGADLVYIEQGQDPEYAVEFKALTGERQCAEGSEAADVCPTVWPEIARQLGLLQPEMPDMGPDVDMGTPPEDMGSGVPEPRDDKGEGSSCATTSGGPAIWLFMALAVGLRYRRRERRDRLGHRL
jgi:hypothetical protein